MSKDKERKNQQQNVPKNTLADTEKKISCAYAKIGVLKERLKKSKDPLEQAQISDEVSRLYSDIDKLKSIGPEPNVKNVSEVPSVFDKETPVNASPVSRGQIVGEDNMFVSVL